MSHEKLPVSFLEFACEAPCDAIDVTAAEEILDRLRKLSYQCIAISGLLPIATKGVPCTNPK